MTVVPVAQLLDWLAPNLGTTQEVWAWALHDLLGHGVYGGYAFCNDCLRSVPREFAGYSKARAGVVYAAVSSCDDWYGEPAFDDKSFQNLEKIHVRHYDK